MAVQVQDVRGLRAGAVSPVADRGHGVRPGGAHQCRQLGLQSQPRGSRQPEAGQLLHTHPHLRIHVRVRKPPQGHAG